jgi:hypothetical protein
LELVLLVWVYLVFALFCTEIAVDKQMDDLL